MLGSEKGFTLVEMMVVVIILSIIASIAVPTYGRFKLRTRAQEPLTYLPQIRARQIVYYEEFRTYLSTTNNPSTYPCSSSQSWAGSTNFDKIGFKPANPHLYFQYWVKASTSTDPMSAYSADITATCNGLLSDTTHYPNGGDWFTVCARGDLVGIKCGTPDQAPTWVGISGSESHARVFSKGID